MLLLIFDYNDNVDSLARHLSSRGYRVEKPRQSLDDFLSISMAYIFDHGKLDDLERLINENIKKINSTISNHGVIVAYYNDLDSIAIARLNNEIKSCLGIKEVSDFHVNVGVEQFKLHIAPYSNPVVILLNFSEDYKSIDSLKLQISKRYVPND